MRYAASLVLLAWVLAWAPLASASLVLNGFATDLPDNHDAFEIRSLGTEAIIGGLQIRDRQGSLAVPQGARLGANGSVFLATNVTAFRDAFGRDPDFARDHIDPNRRLDVRGGIFALAKGGDHLVLSNGEVTLDAVRYGDAPALEPGWIGDSVEVGPQFLRWFSRTGANDTDSASDWTPLRRSYAGEDLFPASPWIAANEALAYTAPEHSRAVVLATLLSAQQSLKLNVYQFRDVALAITLAEHIRSTPSLKVEILLDERPVGENREELSERGHVVSLLSDAGATIRFLPHQRYAYNHAKYAIVDGALLLVQTENLVPSGIPPDGREGNRGWGIVIQSGELSEAAARVFDADFATRPFGARKPTESDQPTFPLPLVSLSYQNRIPIVIEEELSARLIATPFRSPGAEDPILEMIRQARSSIDVAQLDFVPLWRTPNGTYIPHPYLASIVEAAERGVIVRILLDGTFLDDSRGGDNADLVAAIASSYSGLPIEARLLQGGVLHAKGMLVDRSMSLVGSMNWNANSLGQNRELGVAVQSSAVARALGEAFESDWKASGPWTIPSADVATVLTLVGLALAVMGRSRR